VITLGVKET